MSVLPRTWPRPGKCFTAVATPTPDMPRTNAVALGSTSPAVLPSCRSKRPIGPLVAGRARSAPRRRPAARSRLTPAARSWRAHAGPAPAAGPGPAALHQGRGDRREARCRRASAPARPPGRWPRAAARRRWRGRPSPPSPPGSRPRSRGRLARSDREEDVADVAAGRSCSTPAGRRRRAADHQQLSDLLRAASSPVQHAAYERRLRAGLQRHRRLAAEGSRCRGRRRRGRRAPTRPGRPARRRRCSRRAPAPAPWSRPAAGRSPGARGVQWRSWLLPDGVHGGVTHPVTRRRRRPVPNHASCVTPFGHRLRHPARRSYDALGGAHHPRRSELSEGDAHGRAVRGLDP